MPIELIARLELLALNAVAARVSTAIPVTPGVLLELCALARAQLESVDETE